MKSIEFVGGVVMIAYQDNGLGVNQDDGYTQDETDLTKATIFARLKPQATLTRADILDLFVKCALAPGDGALRMALAKACKCVEGATFYAMYEGYFYEMRKLSSRTNKVPLRFSKLSKLDSTLVPKGPSILHSARIGNFCLSSLYAFPGVKLRVKIIGRPYQHSWGKKKSKDSYADPINFKEVIDEPIGS